MDDEPHCSNLQANLIYCVAVSVQSFPLSVLNMYLDLLASVTFVNALTLGQVTSIRILYTFPKYYDFHCLGIWLILLKKSCSVTRLYVHVVYIHEEY
jgi:hypothetical protein